MDGVSIENLAILMYGYEKLPRIAYAIVGLMLND
jgi:hypothetical protein